MESKIAAAIDGLQWECGFGNRASSSQYFFRDKGFLVPKL